MVFYNDDRQSEPGWNRRDGVQEPCIVCGHESGSCSGSQEPPRDILLLGTVPSLEGTQTVYVDEDIYGERTIGDLTSVKFLIARKGSQVSLSMARQLGII